jgi:glycosyltransferase involved in cell wall biosynthesis
MDKRPRLLFVHNALTEFVRLDLEELRKSFDVTERCERSRVINPISLWNDVKSHDVVFGWFASWHTFLPVEFAKLLGKPSVLIVGGYDVANMPEIGYGHQRGGLKKWMSYRTMRLATRVFATSNYSLSEVRHLGLTNGQARTVYLGVPDKFAALNGNRRRTVLTVGNVNRSNLLRKGHEPFVRAAALMPEVEFVLVGAWQDDAIDYLRGIASPNVTFTGRVTDDELADYYLKASVYVQPSLHEGFGMSVAEAMLAGCVPVTTSKGSLPEVVGDAGFIINSAEPTLISGAIHKALEVSEDARTLCRERILRQFSLSNRRQLLEEIISTAVCAARN